MSLSEQKFQSSRTAKMFSYKFKNSSVYKITPPQKNYAIHGTPLYFADVDNGTTLKKLVAALKELTANNFPQAPLTLGCVGLGSNYDTVQEVMGGCTMGVLYGHPLSGKTTVLQVALSVVGQSDIIHRKLLTCTSFP